MHKETNHDRVGGYEIELYADGLISVVSTESGLPVAEEVVLNQHKKPYRGSLKRCYVDEDGKPYFGYYDLNRLPLHISKQLQTLNYEYNYRKQPEKNQKKAESTQASTGNQKRSITPDFLVLESEPRKKRRGYSYTGNYKISLFSDGRIKLKSKDKTKPDILASLKDWRGVPHYRENEPEATRLNLNKLTLRDELQLRSLEFNYNYQRDMVQAPTPREIKAAPVLFPSEDLAWFLGALCGDGYVAKYGITLQVTSKSFVDKFAQIGSKLFDLNPNYGFKELSKQNPNWNDVFSASFNSVSCGIRLFGDLKAEAWPTTVKEKFPWLMGSDSYKWAFLNGFFDSEGSVSDLIFEENKKDEGRRNIHRIRFAIAYTEVVNFVLAMIQSLGVKASISRSQSKREGIAGISIEGIHEVIKVSKMLHSSVEHRERRLALYRSAKVEHPYKEQMIAIYQEVMKLRNDHNLSGNQIIQHPDLVNFNLPISRVNNWIHAGSRPENTNHGIQISYLDPASGKYIQLRES